MSIDREDVIKVAGLARLKLSEQNVDKLVPQFQAILGYMDRLSELETSEVEPLYSPLSQPALLRKDEVKKTCSRQDVLANAPLHDGEFYIVPRVV